MPRTILDVMRDCGHRTVPAASRAGKNVSNVKSDGGPRAGFRGTRKDIRDWLF
jgi:hypothetical protein